MAEQQEFIVTHIVRQTVPAESAEQAERLASNALEKSHSLWWPDVEHQHTGPNEE